MNLSTTVWIDDLQEEDITIKDDEFSNRLMVNIGNVLWWLESRDDLALLHAAFGEYLAKPLCELCDNGTLATGIAQDELGNDLHVCDDHAEQLAVNTAERQADERYNQEHKSGDE